MATQNSSKRVEVLMAHMGGKVANKVSWSKKLLIIGSGVIGQSNFFLCISVKYIYLCL